MAILLRTILLHTIMGQLLDSIATFITTTIVTDMTVVTIGTAATVATVATEIIIIATAAMDMDMDIVVMEITIRDHIDKWPVV
jgi:hypothetical protein